MRLHFNDVAHRSVVVYTSSSISTSKHWLLGARESIPTLAAYSAWANCLQAGRAEGNGRSYNRYENEAERGSGPRRQLQELAAHHRSDRHVLFHRSKA